MLSSCASTGNPGVTSAAVGPAILEQHDAGTLHPEWIRGSYGLVGGGAGFLLLEVDDPQALNAMLAPSMRSMTWDIRAIVAEDASGLASSDQATPSAPPAEDKHVRALGVQRIALGR